MRVIVDTNVFFSAIFHPSPQFALLMEYLFSECDTLIPSYIADELRAKAILKHPDRASLAEEFLETLGLPILNTSGSPEGATTIDDPDDQPILDAAIACNADVIISGDKHFLRLEINHPRIMRPADFIAEFIGQSD